MTTTAVETPAPESVLTSEFPDAKEMIGWAWGHALDWVGANLLLTIVLAVVTIVWYFTIVIRRAVTSI